MSKKVLILGASGMLGHTLFHHLFQQEELTVYGTLRQAQYLPYFSEIMQKNLLLNIDVLSQDELTRLMIEIRPDFIINCVGLIKQLKSAKDPLAVLPLNSLFPHRLLDLAELINAKVIHISTDCVFSGRKGMYTEADECDPIDLYGTSKQLGELTNHPNAITLRTSIIGHELRSHYSLIDWFLKQEGTVQGYNKAIYSGLPTIELASVIYTYVLPNSHLSGLYHVSSDPIDKYQLLKLVAEIYNKDIDIIPSSEVQIDRSLNSDLFRRETGYIPTSWPDLITKMNNFR